MISSRMLDAAVGPLTTGDPKAARCFDAVQLVCDPIAGQGRIGDQRQAFTRAVVGHGENPEPAPPVRSGGGGGPEASSATTACPGLDPGGRNQTSNAILAWAERTDGECTTSRPASRPITASSRALHGRLRDELLNETLFHSLPHAGAVLAAWRRDYNYERPHSRLGWMTPDAYRLTCVETDRGVALRQGSAPRPLATHRPNGSDQPATLASSG